MNRKSFFNCPLPRMTRWKYNVFGLTFPDTYVEDDFGFELGEAVRNHPNVEIEWVNHTHTKYYVFDERVMTTGSINIEDRHRGYQDYMFEIAASSTCDGSENGTPAGHPTILSGRSTSF